MDFHGIDTRGKIWIERIATKPADSSDNDGRLILASDTGFLSFGVASVWIDIANASGVDVTSNPDPDIAQNTSDIADNTSDITDLENGTTPFPWDSDVRNFANTEIIPAGTIMLFDAATAILGWGLEVAVDDQLVYISSGGASGTKGTWTQPGHIHATRSHTLTISEMPSHSHPPKAGVSNFMSSTGSSHGESGDSYGVHSVTGNAGGGGSHNHGNVYSNGTVSTWRPEGRNFTRQSKNTY